MLQEQRESRDPPPEPEQQEEAPGKELEPSLPFQRHPLNHHLQTGSRDWALPWLSQNFHPNIPGTNSPSPTQLPPSGQQLDPAVPTGNIPGWSPGRAQPCPPPSRDRLCPGHVFPEDFFEKKLAPRAALARRESRADRTKTAKEERREAAGPCPCVWQCQEWLQHSRIPVLVPGSARVAVAGTFIPRSLSWDPSQGSPGTAAPGAAPKPALDSAQDRLGC